VERFFLYFGPFLKKSRNEPAEFFYKFWPFSVTPVCLA
jgi:hypothetical protein